MKYTTLVKVFCSFIPMLLSCKKNDLPNNETAFLKLVDRYAGTYKIITSETNVEVDLNDDGIPTINLLNENQKMNKSYVQVKVSRDEFVSGKSSGLFEQFWPEQYFVLNGKTLAPEEIDGYDSSVRVYDLLQGKPRSCKINENERSVVILNDSHPSSPRLWTIPTTIPLKDEDKIKVVIEKSIYTKLG